MRGLLEGLASRPTPVPIGIVGIGSIGRGMLLQADLTPGIRCVAIADIVVGRCIDAAERFGLDYRVVGSPGELEDAVAAGRLAICESGDWIAESESVEVFMEATNSTLAGRDYGIRAIEAGKHLVMMNYEADLVFGPDLMRRAADRGLVYSVCDGDQPAVLRRLIDEMRFMGFRLVMAGNVKGYLDRYADPTSIEPEARKRDLDPQMCASYTDGTKLCVELSVLANGLGLDTTVPGMIGPRMGSIYEIFDHYDFDDLWDGETGLVDYVLGPVPKGGVFAIGYTDHPYQQDTLAWFPPDMGPPPYYLFYRPYHLGHFESMATVAEAVLHGRSVLEPSHGFRTNVFAYAKTDLRPGDTLDGPGGYACYGMIENCADDPVAEGVPICLAEGIRVQRPVARDARLSFDDLDPATVSSALTWFREAVRVPVLV